MSQKRDLQSKQRARILDLICEGRIAGLCDASGTVLSWTDRNKGILLEMTPVQNSDGTTAVSGVNTDFRIGTANQSAITGFPSAEQEVAVEAEVLNGGDKWAHAVQRQIAAGGHNAVRVALRVPALYMIDDAGNRVGADLGFYVQLKRSAESTWIDVVGSNPDAWGGHDGLIQGEAVSPYVRTYRIPLYGEGPWDMRVAKENPESTDPTKLQNSLFWQSYTLITDQTLTFRHSCIGAVEMDAEQQSRIMARAYRLKGMLVRVPSNYDQETRCYDGVWDGKFAGCDLTLSAGYTAFATTLAVTATAAALPNNSLIRFITTTKVLDAYLDGDHAIGATSLKISPIPQNLASGAEGYGYHLKWTNNPAWLYYDLLTANRYGVGNYVPEWTIDRWGLYSISRYCDGVDVDGNFVGVPDGKGGYEPRFACSLYIASQAEAYKVIADLASVFRAMIYWGAGFITAVQDSPKTPSFSFTNANVIDGVFTYSGSARKSRHTMVNVQWNDPDDYSKSKVEQVAGDDEDIDRLGYREANVAAFGCMSRGQAIRTGKWLLLTEKYEKETVVFRGGFEVARCRPGMIIRVRDRLKTVNRMGGRIKAVGSSSLELDAPVVIGAGTYTLVVTKQDGTSADLTVTGSAGTRQILDVTGSLTGIVPNAVWILQSSSLEPTLWRVLNTKENERHIFEVAALRYVADKFDAIESGIAITVPKTSDLPPISVPAPVDTVTITESIVRAQEKTERRLNVSWTAAAGVNVRGYMIEMRTPGSEWRLHTAETPAIALAPVIVTAIGVYEFRVMTVGYYNLKSYPTAESFTLASLENPTLPTALTLLSGEATAIPLGGGSSIPMLLVTWTAPDVSAEVMALMHTRVQWTPTASVRWMDWGWITADQERAEIVGLQPGVEYRVRIRSEIDQFNSDWVTSDPHTFFGDVSPPADPSGLTATAGTGKAISLTWPAVTGADEYTVYRGSSSDTGAMSIIAQVSATRFVDVTVSVPATYYYAIKSEDYLGNVSGFSNVASATTASLPDPGVPDLTPTNPSAPTLDSGASGTKTAGDGTVTAYLVINLPALPTNAVLLNIYFRTTGAAGWILSDQYDADRRAAVSTTTIDDLPTNTSIDVMAQAVSQSGRLSDEVAATGSPFTTPGASAPNPPTSLSVSLADADLHRCPVAYAGAGGAKYGAGMLKWTAPSNKDVAYYQIWRSAGVPSQIGRTRGTETEFVIYDAIMVNFTTDDILVKTVNTSGVVSTTAGTLSQGDYSLSDDYGPGTLAMQDASSVTVGALYIG